jgi:hypothetical protein
MAGQRAVDVAAPLRDLDAGERLEVGGRRDER